VQAHVAASGFGVERVCRGPGKLLPCGQAHVYVVSFSRLLGRMRKWCVNLDFSMFIFFIQKYLGFRK
jgi:hypothetical protein